MTGSVLIKLMASNYTFTPNSSRLINGPITLSCISADLEKQIVLLMMVALHGWNNFRSMLTGWKREPEYLDQNS
jgi:hypothetical protein